MKRERRRRRRRRNNQGEVTSSGAGRRIRQELAESSRHPNRKARKNTESRGANKYSESPKFGNKQYFSQKYDSSLCLVEKVKTLDLYSLGSNPDQSNL